MAAAANLKTAAEELEKGFEAEQPGVEVTLTLGASGSFFAQLQNGAPFDLFLSADREYPQKVVAAGARRRAEDEKVYAFGKLVAWLPPGSTLDLEKRGPGRAGRPGGEADRHRQPGGGPVRPRHRGGPPGGRRRRRR